MPIVCWHHRLHNTATNITYVKSLFVICISVYIFIMFIRRTTACVQFSNDICCIMFLPEPIPLFFTHQQLNVVINLIHQNISEFCCRLGFREVIPVHVCSIYFHAFVFKFLSVASYNYSAVFIYIKMHIFATITTIR